MMKNTAKTATKPASRQAAVKTNAARPANAKVAPKPASGPKKAAQKKKRGLPLIEIIVFILLVKIGAGAYYILKTPDGGTSGATAISTLSTLPDKVFLLMGLGSQDAPEEANSAKATVGEYIAAAAEAVSPSAAHAATPAATAISTAPAAAVTQNAMASGAFMVLGAQAASGSAADTGIPPMPQSSIPLPPGSDDLLTPAAQLPPTPLPSLGTQATEGSPAGLSGENVPAPAQLRSREQELAQKEAALASKEEALSTLEGELNRRLDAMETSRAEIQTMTQRNEAILAEQKALREQQQKEDATQRDARIEHLVTAYKGMKAEQAGMLINSMEDDVAVEILSAMPGRNAGLILAMVNPEKAARLTKAISEKRIDPNLLLADAPQDAAAQ